MKNLKITIWFVLLFGLWSCQNRRIKNEYMGFIDHQIVLPDTLIVINNGAVEKQKSELKKPTLILYNDSTSCNACRISHLFEYENLFDLSIESGAFDVMIIFSPLYEELDMLIRDLALSGFTSHIYVDGFHTFSKLNAHIPSDKRFHSFLVDEFGTPLFVGDPIQSKNLWRLFSEIINNQNNTLNYE